MSMLHTSVCVCVFCGAMRTNCNALNTRIERRRVRRSLSLSEPQRIARACAVFICGAYINI